MKATVNIFEQNMQNFGQQRIENCIYVLFYRPKREGFARPFSFGLVWLKLYRYDLNKEPGKSVSGKEI